MKSTLTILTILMSIVVAALTTNAVSSVLRISECTTEAVVDQDPEDEHEIPNDVSCLGSCTGMECKRIQKNDPQPGFYYTCACGGTETGCCHIIVRVNEGSRTFDKKGSCPPCEGPAGTCELDESDPLDPQAYCTGVPPQ